MSEPRVRGGTGRSSPDEQSAGARWAAWFHALDAWTEYWDVYHPETRGRFCFGDGGAETGLLTHLLPRDRQPRVFTAWGHAALGFDSDAEFDRELGRPEVQTAVREIDALVARLFAEHFGDAADPAVRADYLAAMFAFAIDELPAAAERAARIADDDPRKRTAGRHTLDGDLMWFAWSLHLEAAHALAGWDAGGARRALQLAGVAVGCAANFAWRGHRRTRAEYRADEPTRRVLFTRGAVWASDIAAAAGEVHALYRIREWGSDETPARHATPATA